MNNQQLAIFKIDKNSDKNLDETMLFCGYANDKEQVMSYLSQVQNEIDQEFNNELEGDYIVLPALHFKLTRK